MTKQERQTQILETVRNNGVDILSTRSLAETFNVSEITIRRDLQELAHEGLIQRQHGGVSVPKVPTASLRHVGILLAHRHGKFSHPFFNEVLEGADRKLQSLGYHPAFVKTSVEVDSVQAIKDLIESHPIEGLLVLGELKDEQLSKLREHIPHIVSTAATGDGILFDGQSGVEQMMTHLIEMNYKRIAFIASNGPSGLVDSRLKGYISSLTQHKLAHDPDLIFEMDQAVELFPYKISRQGAEKLMNLTPPPEVIMCSSDMIALGVMQWLQEHGYCIPEDVAVTGFDDIPESVRTFPPLTTVHVHKQLMGKLAAELLHRRIENPSDPPIKIMTPTYLVVRESCSATKMLEEVAS